jgi:CcmD family protein
VGYIIAAFGVVLISLAIYAARLEQRRRQLRSRLTH